MDLLQFVMRQGVRRIGGARVSGNGFDSRAIERAPLLPDKGAPGQPGASDL